MNKIYATLVIIALVGIFVIAGVQVYNKYTEDKCENYEIVERDGYLYTQPEAIMEGCVQVPEPNTNLNADSTK